MATEKRLIDANALIRKSIAVQAPRTSLTLLPGQQWMDTVHAVRVIDIMSEPTVDAVEVKHGRWDRVIPSKSAAKWSTKVSCSNCHKAGYTRFNYCPNCGAKMDGDGNG